MSVRRERLVTRLRALDAVVLGHRYGDGWLIALSVGGLVFVGLWILALLTGRNWAYFDIGAAVGLWVVPLVELWTRRRAAKGKTTFARLDRLDDRVFKRRAAWRAARLTESHRSDS